MAEQQQVLDTEIKDVEDDEEQTKHTYIAPCPKSYKEIMETDKNDKSLQDYKKKLLGCGAPKLFSDPDGKRARLKSMAVIFQEGDSDKPPFEIDLTDKKQLTGLQFKVKEGSKYKIQVTFQVQEDILSGLKLINKVSRALVTEKEEFMLGSWRPNKNEDEWHVFTSSTQEFPHGLLYRGEYKVKSRFTDDDKMVYLEWDWSFKIGKD